MTIPSFLGADHQHCDDGFANAEAAVSEARWTDAARDFAGFLAAMRRHFSMEEEVLFPAFEGATGMTIGPTQVMRSEHAQMNEIMDALQEALQSQDAEAYLGHSETLLLLMRQHNMKEEQVLYPMCEQHLNSAELIASMQAL
jgi:hemerythrin-like domain-containing protein